MVARELLRVTPVGDRIRGNYIDAASCLRAAAEPVTWPLGAHAAGYKYKTTHTHTIDASPTDV